MSLLNEEDLSSRVWQAGTSVLRGPQGEGRKGGFPLVKSSPCTNQVEQLEIQLNLTEWRSIEVDIAEGLRAIAGKGRILVGFSL